MFFRKVGVDQKASRCRNAIYDMLGARSVGDDRELLRLLTKETITHLRIHVRKP